MLQKYFKELFRAARIPAKGFLLDRVKMKKPAGSEKASAKLINGSKIKRMYAPIVEEREEFFDVTELNGLIFQEDVFKIMRRIPDDSIDLAISDGPYDVTSHKWDKINGIQNFNLRIIREAARILKPGGSLYLFGKHDCIDFIDYRPYLSLSNKIIWYQPSRLAQGRIRYTNNYDLICHFTKGRPRTFNLDDIRVPQLVELNQRKRCENVPSVKNGKFHKTKFNDKGKNPGDVWGDIKQLTYKSKELVSRSVLNTIQKPEKLLERIVKASSNRGDIVFDLFAGTGTVHKVGMELDRVVFGCEKDVRIAEMARARLLRSGITSTQVVKV